MLWIYSENIFGKQISLIIEVLSDGPYIREQAYRYYCSLKFSEKKKESHLIHALPHYTAYMLFLIQILYIKSCIHTHAVFFCFLLFFKMLFIFCSLTLTWVFTINQSINQSIKENLVWRLNVFLMRAEILSPQTQIKILRFYYPFKEHEDIWSPQWV